MKSCGGLNPSGMVPTFVNSIVAEMLPTHSVKNTVSLTRFTSERTTDIPEAGAKFRHDGVTDYWFLYRMNTDTVSFAAGSLSSVLMYTSDVDPALYRTKHILSPAWT